MVLHDWLKSGPVSVGDKKDCSDSQSNLLQPHQQVKNETAHRPDNGSASYDPDAYMLCLRILRNLGYKVQKKQIRAMENIPKALSIESTEKLARIFAEAIRPGVVPFLRALDGFDVSRKVIFRMGIIVIDFG